MEFSAIRRAVGSVLLGLGGLLTAAGALYCFMGWRFGLAVLCFTVMCGFPLISLGMSLRWMDVPKAGVAAAVVAAASLVVALVWHLVVGALGTMLLPLAAASALGLVVGVAVALRGRRPDAR